MDIFNFIYETMTKPELYGIFHIISLLITVSFCAIIILKRHSFDEKKVKGLLLIFWLTVVVFEIIKQIRFSYTIGEGWEYDWYYFPFQFCSSIFYSLPLALFIPNRRFKDFMYSFIATFNLFAGVIVMLYPSTVFIETTFINVQTMMHHGIMILSGVLMYAAGLVKLDFKTPLKGTAVFSCFIVTALALNIIFKDKDGFNMFYIDVEGCELPLLGTIFDIAPYPVFLLVYIVGFAICATVVFLAAYGILKLPKKGEKIS